MQDMLEEVRLAATLHKARLYDPKAIPAQAAWHMGTVEGAKALWLYRPWCFSERLSRRYRTI